MLKQVCKLLVIILSFNLAAVAQSGRVRQRDSGNRPAAESAPVSRLTGDLVIPKGTVIELRLDRSLSSKDNAKGDNFTATVTEPVFVNDRMLITPSNLVKCHIINAQPAARNRSNGTLTVGFDEIVVDGRTLTLHATLVAIADRRDDDVIDEGGEGKIKNPAKRKNAPVTIGTSAGIGATIGAIGGAPGGAIGGGAIGAGVGLGSILLSKGQDMELLSGTILKIKLDNDLNLAEIPNK